MVRRLKPDRRVETEVFCEETYILSGCETRVWRRKSPSSRSRPGLPSSLRVHELEGSIRVLRRGFVWTLPLECTRQFLPRRPRSPSSRRKRKNRFRISSMGEMGPVPGWKRK
eukprot:3386649-Rhodomonas_salina.1